MKRLQVRFATKEIAELRVRNLIRAGTETRQILLPSLVRAIRFGELEYRHAPTGGEATVTVLGRQT